MTFLDFLQNIIEYNDIDCRLHPCVYSARCSNISDWYCTGKTLAMKNNFLLSVFQLPSFPANVMNHVKTCGSFGVPDAEFWNLG